MTKSRTLRKAGAVVLSLAMAATTVFAGGIDSKAASKVKLSSTSKTFAAKGGTATVKIKGATSAKISSTTVKSSKTSVATVKKSSKVKFKVTAKKNTATKKKTATITAKVKIAKKYQKKYTKKSYSLKYKVTVKAAAAPTEAPTEAPVEVSVTLDTTTGARQADGSVLAGEGLAISYGSALGQPTAITWYCDNKVVNVFTTEAGSIGDGMNMGGAGATAGTWYVEVKNTVGKIYKSNELVVKGEAKAEIKSFTITDSIKSADNVSLAKNDAKAVVTVILNKNYDGTVKIYPATATKSTESVKSFTTTKLGTGTHDAIEAYKGSSSNDKLVSALPSDDVITLDAAVGSDNGIGNDKFVGAVNADGSVTYKFKTTLTRGTKYIATFDQTNIEKTDLGEDDVIISSEVEAPYLPTPASIKMTTFAGTTTVTATLVDAAGADMTYITEANSSVTTSVIKPILYVIDSITPSATDGAATNSSIATKDGVITFTGTTYNNNYAYVKATPSTDVFGSDAKEITSTVLQKAGAACDSVSFKQSSSDPTAAEVTFTNLKADADGKVYILRGTNNAAGTAKLTDAQIVALGTAAATASADVTGGVKTVTVEKAFTKAMATPAATGGADDDKGASTNTFVALFVPTDSSKYAEIASSTTSNNAFELTDTTVVSYKFTAAGEADLDGSASLGTLVGLTAFGTEVNTGLATELTSGANFATKAPDTAGAVPSISVSAAGAATVTGANTIGYAVGNTYTITTSYGKFTLTITTAGTATAAKGTLAFEAKA